MSTAKLQILRSVDRLLYKRVRLFLPDGTEIPNLVAIQMNPGTDRRRCILELDDCEFVEIDEPPDSGP